MNSKRAIIILGKNVGNHKLKVFNFMIDYYKWEFFVILWGNHIVESSVLVKYFDFDKILNLQYKLFPFFNNRDLVRSYLEKSNPKLLIFVGDFDNMELKDIPENKIPKILIGNITNSNLIFSKVIKDSLISKITNNQVDYVPKPRINYQDFLDFDTNQSLKIKQDNNLVLYENGIISKQKVIAFATYSDNPLLLKNLITNEGHKYVNINNIKDSEIIIPEIDEDNAPIVFEVIDMLVINQNIDEGLIQKMLWCIASGTILVLPRTEEFINFIGNGALYYRENSTSELKACLQVLDNNIKKIKEIRDNAMIILQKKFSYKSIANSWESILSKFTY